MKKWDARAVRRIAENVLHKLVREQHIAEHGLDDLAVSLVRQWQTYEGHALLDFPSKSFGFRLTATPDGFNVAPTLYGQWLEPTFRYWQVPLERLAGALEQLNLSQSAEVASADGSPLRLWADPRQGTHGIERLDELPPPETPLAVSQDLRQLAALDLERALGSDWDPGQRAVLADAVARQWEQYEGQACVFLSGNCQLVMVRTERPEGGVRVSSVKLPVEIARLLVHLGVPPEAVPVVLNRLNAGAQVEYLDRRGVLSILWYDVPQRRLGSWPRDTVAGPGRAPRSAAVPATLQPAFPLGAIELEPRAMAVLAEAGQDVFLFLNRHAALDWGDIGERGAFDNELALQHGGPVRSVYYTSRGERLLVTTLADRTRTVVSSPDPRIAADIVRLARG